MHITGGNDYAGCMDLPPCTSAAFVCKSDDTRPPQAFSHKVTGQQVGQQSYTPWTPFHAFTEQTDSPWSTSTSFDLSSEARSYNGGRACLSLCDDGSPDTYWPTQNVCYGRPATSNDTAAESAFDCRKRSHAVTSTVGADAFRSRAPKRARLEASFDQHGFSWQARHPVRQCPEVSCHYRPEACAPAKAQFFTAAECCNSQSFQTRQVHVGPGGSSFDCAEAAHRTYVINAVLNKLFLVSEYCLPEDTKQLAGHCCRRLWAKQTTPLSIGQVAACFMIATKLGGETRREVPPLSWMISRTHLTAKELTRAEAATMSALDWAPLRGWRT